MLVWSESNYLPCSGSCSQVSLKSHITAMCTVMGCSTTPAAISCKSSFLCFYSMFGDTFFSFPRDSLGSQRFYAYCMCRRVPHDGARIPWMGSRSSIRWDALVRSCPSAALEDYFWPRLCWEETLELYTIKFKHINAMLRNTQNSGCFFTKIPTDTMAWHVLRHKSLTARRVEWYNEADYQGWVMVVVDNF